MAKLTKKDKEFLKKIGYLEEDFNQIEKANYKYYTKDDQRISEEEALKKLGRYRWLSGIGRACFHASSVRDYKRGSGYVYINSDIFR